MMRAMQPVNESVNEGSSASSENTAAPTGGESDTFEFYPTPGRPLPRRAAQIIAACQSPPEEIDAGQLNQLPEIDGYEILEPLGMGGMGIVYRAVQKQPRRMVAIKMMRFDLAHDHERLARFHAEVNAIVRLQHPNVVNLYEFGVHNKRPYFTMEYVEGGSLDQSLATGDLSFEATARIFSVLSRALHDAHGRGVVHRDLKPANILLASDGTPKIADFGLAKLAHGSPANTRCGVVMGTPGYMAPEQAEGDDSIGPAADIYAVGATLFQCLTGRLPQSPVGVREAQASSQPTHLRGRSGKAVPRDLEAIVLKCLCVEPAQRYPHAGALAADLERFLQGRPTTARKTSCCERAYLWARRNRATASLLLVLALLPLLLACWWPPRDPVGNTLNQSRSLLHQSCRDRDQGLIQDALQSSTQACALRARLRQRLPEDPTHQLALGYALIHHSDLLQMSGKPGQAEQAFKQARSLLQEIPEQYFDKAHRSRHEAQFHIRRGDALRLADAVQAERYHHTALQILRPLSPRSTPDNGLFAENAMLLRAPGLAIPGWRKRPLYVHPR